MIGPAKQSLAMQAVLGPKASSLFPNKWWGAWLDDELEVIAMTNVSVLASSFGASGAGVANIAIVDGGIYPAEEPAFFGLMDAKNDGALGPYGPVSFLSTPSAGDSILFAPGAVTLTYLEA
jgi:hypothetical protein